MAKRPKYFTGKKDQAEYAYDILQVMVRFKVRGKVCLTLEEMRKLLPRRTNQGKILNTLEALKAKGLVRAHADTGAWEAIKNFDGNAVDAPIVQMREDGVKFTIYPAAYCRGYGFGRSDYRV